MVDLRHRRPVAGFVAILVALVGSTSTRAQTSAGDIARRVHGVEIADGERVVLRPDGEGAPVVIVRGAAAPASIVAPNNDTKVETLETVKALPIAAEPGTLSASFRNFPGKGAALRVENGFDHPVIYDAMIVQRRGGETVVMQTSICPVAPRGSGTEGWGPAVTGVILSKVREPAPGDLRCSNGSGLVATPPTTPANLCLGQVAGSPITVRLQVDPPTGAPRGAEADWTLTDPTGGPLAPQVILDFPMQGDQVAGRPTGMQVLAIVGLDPAPTAKAASIVVLADGREAARRPWRLYARQLQALATLPVGSRPVAIVGSVPFPIRPDQGEVDAQLQALYAGLGDGRVERLEVRIEGDDGHVLGHGAYSPKPAAIRDAAQVAAAARAAEALAVQPGHCARSPAR